MATPTLSLATTHVSSGQLCTKSGKVNKNDLKNNGVNNNGKHNDSNRESNSRFDQAKQTSQQSSHNDRRHVTEEVNEDSIYCICLKKITYTFNNSLNKQANNSNYVTRCDQVDCSKTLEKSNTKWYDEQQVSMWIH